MKIHKTRRPEFSDDYRHPDEEIIIAARVKLYAEQVERCGRITWEKRPDERDTREVHPPPQ